MEGISGSGKSTLATTLADRPASPRFLCHHADPDGQARIGVFFAATRWTGEPVNAEPGKCAKIDWFDPSDLPDGVVTYVRTGIAAHRCSQVFSLDSW